VAAPTTLTTAKYAIIAGGYACHAGDGAANEAFVKQPSFATWDCRPLAFGDDETPPVR
jgi:hypothetical protein